MRTDVSSTRTARLVAAAILALAVAGCDEEPPNATPEGAVRELVERMSRVHGDPADAEAAFELLAESTRKNLTERAERYSAASGKQIEPAQMIAPSRFLLRFEPTEMTAQIVGSEALVDVFGPAASQRAKVECAFEDGVWRVRLPLPPLPPVKLRPGSAATRD